MAWSEHDIGDLTGRTAVVTGANTGIGFETALVLARRGADVVLACRDPARAAGAAERIRLAGGTVRVVPLELGSLRSVRAAAHAVRAHTGRLDLLVANAGVMTPPRGRTEDGFELHIGVNHLGHFALTGLLLEPLLAAPAARVVVVSSVSARYVRMDLADLHGDRRYVGMVAYGRSKLANLLFAHELQDRLATAGAVAVAVAAHPGGSPTEVTRHSPALRAMQGVRVASALTRRMHHPPAQAALPVLRAALDPDVRGGDYYGPDGRLGLTGAPVLVRPTPRALDVRSRRALWAESERLTGVRYLS